MTQRQNKKKGRLSQEQINLLEEINFAWNPQDQQWHGKYKQLLEFYEKERHSSPHSKTELGRWCKRQILRKKDGQLSQEKIKLLEVIEFEWDQKFEKTWHDSYEKVLKFSYMLDLLALTYLRLSS